MAPTLSAPAPAVTASSQEVSAPSGPPSAESPVVVAEASPEPVTAALETVVAQASALDGAAPPEKMVAEEGSDEEGPVGEEEAGEGEAEETLAAGEEGEGPFFTNDLTDDTLLQLWKEKPAELGPISVGFVQSGRLVNSVQFPKGDDWLLVSPDLAWTTQETVDYLTRAIRDVRTQFPRAPPVRVNQISAREGGHLRPHKSHQNGRDVDMGFYYPTVDPVRERAREKYIDLELNWAFIKALATHTDVQMILVDKRIQKVIRDYALNHGEDPTWVASLFDGGNPLIRHARGHRDHFHVRFFNPRAQELGRRIAPLLALQPEQNIMMHRVRNGDTLGGIAVRYRSTIQAIKKSNRLNGILLRIGQVLSVPLRGPCTQCPVPPPVVIPARRLPPGYEEKPAVAGPPVALGEPIGSAGEPSALVQ